MSKMIERISDVIERKMNTSNGCVALEELSRDILLAIREPTKAMVSAAYDAPVMGGPKAVWQAMVDCTLQDRGTT